jgi:hypothetical protein
MMLAGLAAGVSVVTGVTCYHLRYRKGNFLTGSVKTSQADTHRYQVIVLSYRFRKGCSRDEKNRAMRATPGA